MAIPSIQELESLHTNICKAIGEPKRIQILYALHEKPQTGTALAELLDTPQPTISRHLAMMRERGLVECERDGTSVIYRVGDTRIIDVLDTMRGLLRNLLSKQASVLDSDF